MINILHIPQFIRENLLSSHGDSLGLFAPTMKSTAKFIEPGMYWYGDNTFSAELLESKHLRAVVIASEFGKVIGLMLDESEPINLSGCHCATEFVVDNNFYAKSVVRVPRLNDVKKLKRHEKVINRALSASHNLLLNGVYWYWKGLWKYSSRSTFSVGERVSDTGKCAKMRYLIELRIK